MNGFDLTYCTNIKCERKDCRRHYKKIPDCGYVNMSKFKEKNCKYFVRGGVINETKNKR